MKNLLTAITLTLLLCWNGSAIGSDNGTASEAIALVKKGIAFYKANGKEKTAAEINNRTGRFEEKDLYLFMSPVVPGPLIAHGVNQRLVGKAMGDLRDIDGVYFTRRFREIANGEGKGWVDYKWPNNKSGVIEAKSTYIERVDDIYFACGIYKGAAGDAK